MEEVVSLLSQIDLAERRTKLKTEYFGKPSDDLEDGTPYHWQAEFHNNRAKERLLMAGNRSGKSRCGAGEVAIHATGLYPDWWDGRRFESPCRCVVGSDTNINSRDVAQEHLLGPGTEWGTGWVPHASILADPVMRQCGVHNVVDYIQIQHVSGGKSTIIFKTYQQGRAAWEGFYAHVVWLDEEPEDTSIYSEALTRTAELEGILLMTRTPLYGMSEIIRKFIDPRPGASTFYKNATWDDCPHLTTSVKDSLKGSYFDHEIDTRVSGQPMMGSGRVYQVNESDISIDPFAMPDHYRRVCGIDFGIDHPASAVWVAHDADADCLYVYDAYRKSGETPVYHAATIKARGEWIPVSWPHDGINREKSSGKQLKELYRVHGLKMLPYSARYNDEKGGPQDTEPIVMDILERMLTGRFKVFSHLRDWFEEFRLYHRKNGKIVKDHDDLIAATHYAAMMLRCAVPKQRRIAQRATEFYDPLAGYKR